jgi:CDP-diacylglycerol pyrophosphatase
MRAKQKWSIRILEGKPVGRIALFALAVLVLGASVSALLAAASKRQALWEVVRSCLANYDLTGAAFPCLKVDLAGGVEQGYVVLRPPFGGPDTILTPIRRIVGIEDPWLQSPRAPNFFEAAWNARMLVKSLNGKPPGRREAALAVNSRPLRSQDQLHIHIGCLLPSVRLTLEALGPTLRPGEWTQVEGVLSRSEVWVFRTALASLATIEPFRLAADGLGATELDRARLEIAVAEIKVAERGEFFILASRPNASESRAEATAEGIVDPVCSHRANVAEPD